jgi:triacylglycerol esterase/lipase EstA (alpha/beta hydrolase family)
MKSGKYDHKKAPKLWMYLVDMGAKKYLRDYPDVKFDKKVIQQVSQEFADEYKDEIEIQGGSMF